MIRLFLISIVLKCYSSIIAGPPCRRLRTANGGDVPGGEDTLPLWLQWYGRQSRLQVLPKRLTLCSESFNLGRLKVISILAGNSIQLLEAGSDILVSKLREIDTRWFDLGLRLACKSEIIFWAHISFRYVVTSLISPSALIFNDYMKINSHVSMFWLIHPSISQGARLRGRFGAQLVLLQQCVAAGNEWERAVHGLCGRWNQHGPVSVSNGIVSSSFPYLTFGDFWCNDPQKGKLKIWNRLYCSVLVVSTNLMDFQTKKILFQLLNLSFFGSLRIEMSEKIERNLPEKCFSLTI